MKRGFGSDNHSGIHPEILNAIFEANVGHAMAYGEDEWTQEIETIFKQAFGQEANAFLVFNGTGANVLALKAMTQSFQAVICADTAHIHVDECGAPEHFLGGTLLLVNTSDGKITVEGVEQYFKNFGFQHHIQPKVISISQPTELGTLYQPDEIVALANLAHENNMYLHVDGARFSNAAAALNMSLKELSADLGVDALSFGGTKNGLMMGEAVIFFRPELAENFVYRRKQVAQLYSKMRFMSAQFKAYFKDDLWKKLAQHSNNMAQLLAQKILEIKQVQIVQKVEVNGVFARMAPEIIAALLEDYFFYEWDEEQHEVRWLCSWDTTEDDINSFTEKLRRITMR